jgi:hypothetical protein
MATDFDSEKADLQARLAQAKAHLERTNDTIYNCCQFYDLNYNTFRKYLENGKSQIGRPPILTDEEKLVLKLFLLSLETALNTVMPISEVIEWIKRLSSNYQSNPLNVKVSKRTARRILREISLFEGLVLSTADAGRERVVNEVDRFVHFMRMMNLCMSKVNCDPRCIWNVDEVGIQLIERNLRFVTSLINTSTKRLSSVIFISH